MKHFLALLFALVASIAHAQTLTVEWWLNGTIGPYTSQANCDAAAKARPGTPGTSTTYDCPRRVRITFPCGTKPPNDTQPGTCPSGQVVAAPWTVTRSYVTAPAPQCWTAGTWSPSTPPAGSCTTPTSGTWTRIASENESFTVGMNQTVRFGRSPGPYIQKITSGLGQCTLDFFGSDPAPGQGKFCEVLDGSGTPVVVTPPPPPVTLGSATVSWVAPTKNADGTPLTDLAGYRVTCASASDAATMTVATSPAGLSGLTPGTWACTVRAVDASGNESAPSATVSKVIQ